MTQVAGQLSGPFRPTVVRGHKETIGLASRAALSRSLAIAVASATAGAISASGRARYRCRGHRFPPATTHHPVPVWLYGHVRCFIAELRRTLSDQLLAERGRDIRMVLRQFEDGSEIRPAASGLCAAKRRRPRPDRTPLAGWDLRDHSGRRNSRELRMGNGGAIIPH